MRLYLDYETRSSISLRDCGLWKYATDDSTEVILAAYAFDDGPVKLWEPLVEPMPEDLHEAFLDEWGMYIVSWNAAFERLITQFVLKITTSISRYIDPMCIARYMSMPGSLDKVSEIMDIKNKKLKTGKNLIEWFCIPLDPGGWESLWGIEPPSFRDKISHPKLWKEFRKYAEFDIESEREILQRMSKFMLPDTELDLYILDQEINDRGIYCDTVLLQGAMLIVDKEQEALKKQFVELTGVHNPRSPSQILAWGRQHGYSFGSVGKAYIRRALNGECQLDEETKKGFELRLQLSKSSVSKLESAKNAISSDGRVHHLLNFMGASRTARWCLSEGSMIKVKKKTKPCMVCEMPIEKVTTEWLVWDGDFWVEHEGVVFSGEKEVIEWDGVEATAEHEVWISPYEKIPLIKAKEFEIPIWDGN